MLILVLCMCVLNCFIDSVIMSWFLYNMFVYYIVCYYSGNFICDINGF